MGAEINEGDPWRSIFDRQAMIGNLKGGNMQLNLAMGAVADGDRAPKTRDAACSDAAGDKSA
ncbi:hypothetical protein, partial [Agrobacterium radiobacter]|uniref:hypothetical protein n=1 Tax=Agrobacterium radiobacter TaxID=362 RepID=UPI003CE5A02E